MSIIDTKNTELKAALDKREELLKAKDIDMDAYNEAKAKCEALKGEIAHLKELDAEREALKHERAQLMRVSVSPDFSVDVKADAATCEERAFEDYLRTGKRADPLTTVNTAAVIPTILQNSIRDQLKLNNPIRELAFVTSVKHNQSIPIGSDVTGITFIAEGAQYPVLDTKIEALNVKAKKYGGVLNVTRELLYDNGVNFKSWFIRKLVEAIKLAENKAFSNGKGTDTEPQGVASGTNKLTAKATTISEDDVYNLYAKVPSQYKNGAVWLVNSEGLKQIMQLKLTSGESAFKIGLGESFSRTLLGHRIIEVDSLDKKTPLVFGNLKYYEIYDRETASVEILKELGALNDKVGFKVSLRTDAVIVNNDAIAHLELK